MQCLQQLCCCSRPGVHPRLRSVYGSRGAVDLQRMPRSPKPPSHQSLTRPHGFTHGRVTRSRTACPLRFRPVLQVEERHHFPQTGARSSNAENGREASPPDKFFPSDEDGLIGPKTCELSSPVGVPLLCPRQPPSDGTPLSRNISRLRPDWRAARIVAAATGRDGQNPRSHGF